MLEESTTPDPVELVRKQLEALHRGDFDGVMCNVAEDAVFHGRFGNLDEGRAAIRGALEDTFRPYEELNFELEEVTHLGGGVVFAVVSQNGRPVGSDGRVGQREGWVYLCVGGSIARLTTSDVDESAQPPNGSPRNGVGVSEENVEILRSAYEAFARDDVDGILPLMDDHIEWRNPEDSPIAGVWHGHEGVRDWFAQVRESLGEMWFVPEEFVELPDGRVFVRVRSGFRAPQSGVEMGYPLAHLITLRDGLVTRFQMYSDPRRAREVAGLQE